MTVFKNPSECSAAVFVTAPARLHMGFLDLHGGLGRRFGSVGLALERPHTQLWIAQAATLSARGPDADRAKRYARTFLDRFALPGGIEIVIEQAIPAHAGLGSGTQLALAVGLGIARLFALDLPASEVAQLLDRGVRSGIGIGAFEQGGFLVDGGRGEDGQIPPLTCRMGFPEHWRILLIFDSQRQGASGAAEQQAFAALTEFSDAEAGHLCRLILMQALPALAETDIEGFGQAIGELQRRIGNHFAPLQGGRFASPAVAEVLAWLAQQGIAGAGQSSWGPTGFVLCDSETMAKRLLLEAQQRRWPGGRLRFVLCRPRNEPGEIVLQTTQHRRSYKMG